MKELYQSALQFSKDLKELKNKISGLTIFAEKYGDKFNVSQKIYLMNLEIPRTDVRV